MLSLAEELESFKYCEGYSETTKYEEINDKESTILNIYIKVQKIK